MAPDVSEFAAPGEYLTNPIHNDTYPAIDSTKASLTGKSVFISGASKGIGRAMSISFAKAGASQIAIAARSDMTTLVQEIGEASTKAGKPLPRILQIKLDVSSRESIDGAALEVEKEFGKLDILVNNAGVLGNILPLAENDPDDWWNTWTVNIRGPYLITRAFLPLMLRGGDKQIVNVSSVGAHFVTPTMSSYQGTKLALLRFTEHLSAEYSDIVTFCIHPGNILTDMVNGPDSGVPDDLKQIFIDTPELPADTVVYLTSERRTWLNGRYISCNWDMPQLMDMKEELVKGDKLKVRLVV